MRGRITNVVHHGYLCLGDGKTQPLVHEAYAGPHGCPRDRVEACHLGDRRARSAPVQVSSPVLDSFVADPTRLGLGCALENDARALREVEVRE